VAKKREREGERMKGKKNKGILSSKRT